MNDQNIIQKLFARDEKALSDIKEKYNNYLFSIAYNVLHNDQDSEESLNETYLKTWNSIPPHKPDILSSFIAKICRETSIDILRNNLSQKRRGNYDLSFEELEDVVKVEYDFLQPMEYEMLIDCLNIFLRSKNKLNRNIFICRYFYMDSIKDISHYYNISDSAVKSRLFNMRNDLRQYLQKEGFEVWKRKIYTMP